MAFLPGNHHSGIIIVVGTSRKQQTEPFRWMRPSKPVADPFCFYSLWTTWESCNLKIWKAELPGGSALWQPADFLDFFVLFGQAKRTERKTIEFNSFESALQVRFIKITIHRSASFLHEPPEFILLFEFVRKRTGTLKSKSYGRVIPFLPLSPP